MELLTDGVENGAYQQGAEKTLCHGAKGIDAVALAREQNVFSLEEIADFFHVVSHLSQ